MSYHLVSGDNYFDKDLFYELPLVSI